MQIILSIAKIVNFAIKSHFWQSEMQLQIFVQDCYQPGDFDF